MNPRAITHWLKAALLGLVLSLGMGAMAASSGSDAAAQREREATQPSNNAPVWRSVNQPQGHYSAIKTPEANVLIQSEGQNWRLVRNGVITVYGGWLVSLVIAGIAAFYALHGPFRLPNGRSGQLVPRFSALERMSHWGVAITFLILAISGVLILWGRYLVLPWLGGSLYGPLLYVLKNVHNLVGPLFTIAIVVMFVLYVRDNHFSGDDLKWLLSGGKMPSARFNGGEKLWFWLGLTLMGLVVSVSGWVLNSIVPGIDHFTRSQMQLANIVHGVGAVLFIAGALGHIYIGTIGTEGALDGMKTGYVDENWAKEHHALWHDEVKSDRGSHAS